MDSIKSIAVPVRRRSAGGKRRETGATGQAGDTAVSLAVHHPPRPTVAHPVHRFRVGQRLTMSSGSRDIRRVSATCQVTALLPHEAGPLLYRVRSDAESFERVVDELDLAPLR